MGAVASQKGVLKLVHPGRYVEIHKEPITAAEVMKKNPRHSVTRPDVFEYPWIVVKPESILNLGRVFYIVPNSTIYHLLKIKGSSNQPSEQNHSSLLKGILPLKSYAGMTPKHQEHSKFRKQRPLQTMSLSVLSLRVRNCGYRFRKPSQVYSCWPEVIVNRKDTPLEFEEKYTTKIRSFNAKDNYWPDSNVSAEFPKTGDSDRELEHSKQVTKLKSCLKKEDSVRKSRHLTVSFVLPMKNDEQQMRTTESTSEFPGFFIC